MSIAVSFEDYIPPARFDAVPWTVALIEEAATRTSGFTLIDTVSLGAPDGDPANPRARNFTTIHGTAPGLWYRISYRDGAGTTTATTEPVQNVPLVALTTLSAVRLWCLRNAADSSKDDLFLTLIKSVSKRVLRYCQREFFPTNALTRLFAYDGGGYLNLAPYELRAITTITVTPTGGTPITLDNTNPDNATLYKMEPRNGTDEGTYLWLRLPLFNNPGAYPRTSRLGLMSEASVTGDWGMAAIPDDLEEAVLITIEDEYLNPAAAQRVMIGTSQIDPVAARDDEDAPFPRRAMEILGDIRRSEFAA